MAKMVIELEPGLVVSDFQNDDILLYDNVNNRFYRTTAKEFFNEYEKKLVELRKAYDEKVEELTKSNSNLENVIKEQTQEIINYKNEIDNKVNNFISQTQLDIYLFKKQVQENQEKQINMIEKVIKGEEQ